MESSNKQVNSESSTYKDLLTQEHILNLAKSYPKLGICVSSWREGDVTWEQATYMMIIELMELIDIGRRNSGVQEFFEQSRY